LTVTGEVELLIGNISIEWEFSAVVGSGSYSIDHRVEDPHFNSSVSFTLVVVCEGTFLSKRWKTTLDTNERLPLTRFGGLSVTIDVGGESSLIPKL
jgi:hypothetical protein